MALGGGTWLTQNKILPGAYINFVSAARATATLSDRGIATIPVILDWGAQGEMMEITTADLQKNSLALLGYDFTAPELRGIRDLFKNIRLGYIFRLGADGVKAANTYATAKYAGTRGNDLNVVINANVDDPLLFDVMLYMGTVLADSQTAIATASDLIDNGFVNWISTATLTVTAGTPLTGGTSPTPTNADYQTYLNLVEAYSFNAIGCPSNDPAVKMLFAAFTRRMRDEMGVKFQCAMYNPDSNNDFEGIVDILNKATNDDANEQDLFYWVTGILAGTNVNQSATNRVYNGEYSIDVSHTQLQLENAIRGGKFAFHRVGNVDVRVLVDINSLVNTTVAKGDDFKRNQTIRVIDQIGNDIAVVFNTKYLGVIPNDAEGRISLWADIVRHHEQLQTIRAIENFSGEDVTVDQGDTKNAVVVTDVVSVVNAMEKLYMVTTIS